jgi:hypothetical protein
MGQNVTHKRRARESRKNESSSSVACALDTGKILAKDIEDEDIMFARPGPTVEYWEGED